MNDALLKDVPHESSRIVTIPVGSVELQGDLSSPSTPSGLVIFAHGSGSSRRSPRNQWVARALRERGWATLLFDLLTDAEEESYQKDGRLRFDIPLLSKRLVMAARWIRNRESWRNTPLGFFGSSTGAAAALIAAATLGFEVMAVVSRGGRPDLAGSALAKVKSPTLLIVGEADTPVIALNEEAQRSLLCQTRLILVPGATHLFEEPGALAEVAQLAADWFTQHSCIHAPA